jgi:hypothetical protein
LDNPALVPAATYDEEVDIPQLGMILATDLYEEGVKVHVKDAGGHVRAYTRRMAVALKDTMTVALVRRPISSAEAVVTEATSGLPISR